mgnify:FL=1
MKRPFFVQSCVKSIGLRQVHSRCLAIAADFDFVIYALLFIERVHAGSLNSRDVHEAVIAAAIGCNKAIAFVGIEEFYGASRHIDVPFTKQVTMSQQRHMGSQVVVGKRLRGAN